MFWLAVLGVGVFVGAVCGLIQWFERQARAAAYTQLERSIREGLGSHL